jgi:hypothetical protein
LKNIQIIDGADNATYNLFQATDDEFAEIFPGSGRVGEDEARKTLSKLWEKPIYKHDVKGIHDTL